MKHRKGLRNERKGTSAGLPFQVESSILVPKRQPNLMNGNHILLGIVMLMAPLCTLGWRYSTQKKAPAPAWGWLGLAIILLAELLLFLRVRGVEVFFTPIVWTGYLLFADSLVCSLKGSSLIRNSLRSFWGWLVGLYPCG